MRFHKHLVYRFAAALALAAVFFFFFAGNGAEAAPAAPVESVYMQPDGTIVYATQQGDDVLNWTIARDGAVIEQNKDGYWYYAEIRTNRLVPGPVKYAVQAPPVRVLHSDDVVPLHSYYSQLRKASTFVGSRPSKSVRFPGGDARTSQDLSKPHPMLVLLVNFNNVTMSTSESQWQQLVFGTTGKTVNHFYRENSNNRFSFLPARESGGVPNDGVVTVSLPQSHPNTGGNPSNLNRVLAAKALSAADAQVDFASYDTDGNGYISAQELHIMTIIAGQEAAYDDASYRGVPSVWGHHWAQIDSAAPILDGVKLLSADGGGGYTQFGEMQGSHQATIGIIVHELGHDLDLPDLYDVDPANGDTKGVGGFSVMGGGSWAHLATEEAGTTPVHFDAWSKQFLGFAAPVEVPYGTDITAAVSAVDAANPGAYQIYKIKTNNPDEYFLLENRQQGAASGFDQALRTYTNRSGIAIWHIDANFIRNHFDTINDLQPKGVDLESFDNSPDDPFYHDGYTFDRYHKPGSSSNSGAATGISIKVPSASSASMTVKAGTGPSIITAALPASASNSFRYTSQWSEPVQLYYEVLPAGSKTPDIGRLLQGQDSLGNPVGLSGHQALVDGKPGIITVDGLTSATGYDFYIIGVDTDGHLGVSDIQSFSTVLPPVTANIPQPPVPVVPVLPVVPSYPSTTPLPITPPPAPATPEIPTTDTTDVPTSGPLVKANGQKGVTIEQLKPEAGITVNGASTSTWKLDANLLDKSFEALAAQQGSVSRIEVPVTFTAGEAATVELPAESLANAANTYGHAVISITSEGGSYDLPLRALDLRSIGQKLGVSLQDLKVSVQFGRVIGTTANDISRAAARSGLQLVGAPIEFSVMLTGKGVSERIEDFGATFVSRTIVLNETVSGSRASAVVYDPHSGKMAFVPSTFASGNGKTVVTIQRNGNSIYAIVRAYKTFPDIRRHWARADIELLASKTLINGVTETSFAPDQLVTRAQFASMLAQALGLSESKAAANFPDVKMTDWYAGYVGAAVKAGLVHGFNDGSFRPNQKITREQMAAMIDHAALFAGRALAEKAEPGNLAGFKDRAFINSYARISVSNVVKAGIIKGVTVNEFRPSDYATRAQSASIVKRLLVHLHFID